MSWLEVPCLPTVAPDGGWMAACALTEGDELGENHTHWLDELTGVEFVVAWHKDGERPKPNGVIRRVGS